jgi:hypothetical protein
MIVPIVRLYTMNKIRKGYRVKLRRVLNGWPFRNVTTYVEVDVFVDDLPESDRELVALVFKDYAGFSVDEFQRLVI